MSDLRLEFETSKGSMDEIRPHLDTVLEEQFPGGMMKSRWEEDVLHLTGPGAQGKVHLDSGKLVGEASLRPPATLMRPVIEKKMTEVLSRAAR